MLDCIRAQFPASTAAVLGAGMGWRAAGSYARSCLCRHGAAASWCSIHRHAKPDTCSCTAKLAEEACCCCAAASLLLLPVQPERL